MARIIRPASPYSPRRRTSASTKGYYKDKWPCCSGTFPQITADYGISSYFHDGDGVYVNLYTPSRVTWTRGDGRISLTQRTNYPNSLAMQIEISTDKPMAFSLYLRIPGWAGPKTAVAVNGRCVATDLAPGSFARLDGPWIHAARIEIEFDAKTTLEAVDPQHPDKVAPVNGPLALFGVGEMPKDIASEDLLKADRISIGSSTWQTEAATGRLTLMPFASIHDERYRLYHQLRS